jgi:hypothetical protein
VLSASVSAVAKHFLGGIEPFDGKPFFEQWHENPAIANSRLQDGSFALAQNLLVVLHITE